MIYPGKLIKVGEADAAVVTAIANALAARGYPSTSPPGVFDAPFKSLVKLFQSQNVDQAGRPLEIDGEVGSMTWGALFGAATTPITGSLAVSALGMAVTQLGVMEVPLGSNRGPMVDKSRIHEHPAGQFPVHGVRLLVLPGTRHSRRRPQSLPEDGGVP